MKLTFLKFKNVVNHCVPAENEVDRKVPFIRELRENGKTSQKVVLIKSTLRFIANMICLILAAEGEEQGGEEQTG